MLALIGVLLVIGFAGSRSGTLFIVVLPMIGLFERFGLQEQSRRLISRLSALIKAQIRTAIPLPARDIGRIYAPAFPALVG